MAATQRQDIDLLLRHLGQRAPEQLARAFLPDASDLRVGGLAETQFAQRQRRLDRSIDLWLDNRRSLLHLEWQTRMRWTMPARIFEYQSLSILAQPKARGEAPLTIQSIVVLLAGREAPWPIEAEYRISPAGAPFSGARFRIDAVYQRSVEELVARGPMGWILAPLARDATPSAVKHVVKTMQRDAPEGSYEDLAASMSVIAEVDGRKRGFRGILQALFGEKVIMQNWIYQRGLSEGIERGVEKGIEKGIERGFEAGTKKGVEQGLEPLAHLFERRLERPLTERERRTLIARFVSHGPDALGDVVLDLGKVELERWLCEANGHTPAL